MYLFGTLNLSSKSLISDTIIYGSEINIVATGNAVFLKDVILIDTKVNFFSSRDDLPDIFEPKKKNSFKIATSRRYNTPNTREFFLCGVCVEGNSQVHGFEELSKCSELPKRDNVDTVDILNLRKSVKKHKRDELGFKPNWLTFSAALTIQEDPNPSDLKWYKYPVDFEGAETDERYYHFRNSESYCSVGSVTLDDSSEYFSFVTDKEGRLIVSSEDELSVEEFHIYRDVLISEE